MARSRRWLFVLAAVAAVVAIEAVWLAPAALVDAHVARMSGGLIRVTGAAGRYHDRRRTRGGS